MFATEIVETQTVLEKSLGPGILIDLTGVTQRNVSYDIDKGWHWGDDESWAREIPANSQLSPLLTQFSIDLQKQVRQMGFVE
jgi:diadenosine tetraphosphatase ApaH/serine/threonine PP2A family protein phosphatase